MKTPEELVMTTDELRALEPITRVGGADLLHEEDNGEQGIRLWWYYEDDEPYTTASVEVRHAPTWEQSVGNKWYVAFTYDPANPDERTPGPFAHNCN